MVISGSEDGSVYIWDIDYISSFGDLKHYTKKVYSSESFVPFRDCDLRRKRETKTVCSVAICAPRPVLQRANLIY